MNNAAISGIWPSSPYRHTQVICKKKLLVWLTGLSIFDGCHYWTHWETPCICIISATKNLSSFLCSFSFIFFPQLRRNRDARRKWRKFCSEFWFRVVEQKNEEERGRKLRLLVVSPSKMLHLKYCLISSHVQLKAKVAESRNKINLQQYILGWFSALFVWLHCIS